MKDLLLNTLRDESDALRKRNRAREFLQARILLSLQDQGAFANWAFVDGTALRFLYDLPRYSEDLDFSLRAPGDDARFASILRAVKSDLVAEAYEVDIRVREQRTVAAAIIKFRGLLYEMDLSPHRDETFAVKVEMDTNPPSGAVCTTRLVRKHYLLHLMQHDQSSLLAGKLHAVLTRKYTKGRDLYDLLWYLSSPEWPPPNLDLLSDALEQTGWAGEALTETAWRQAIAAQLKNIDWKQAREDVAPFLERSQEINLIAPEPLEQLLR